MQESEYDFPPYPKKKIVDKTHEDNDLLHIKSANIITLYPEYVRNILLYPQMTGEVLTPTVVRNRKLCPHREESWLSPVPKNEQLTGWRCLTFLWHLENKGLGKLVTGNMRQNASKKTTHFVKMRWEHLSDEIKDELLFSDFSHVPAININDYTAPHPVQNSNAS